MTLRNPVSFETQFDLDTPGAIRPKRIARRRLSVDRCVKLGGKMQADWLRPVMPPHGAGWEWWGWWSTRAHENWGTPLDGEPQIFAVFLRHGMLWLTPASDPVNEKQWTIRDEHRNTAAMLARSYPSGNHPVFMPLRRGLTPALHMPTPALIWIGSLPPVRGVYNVAKPECVTRGMVTSDIVVNRAVTCSNMSHDDPTLTTSFRRDTRVKSGLRALTNTYVAETPVLWKTGSAPSYFVIPPGTNPAEITGAIEFLPMYSKRSKKQRYSFAGIERILHQYAAYALLAAFAVPENGRWDKRLRRVNTWVKKVCDGRG